MSFVSIYLSVWKQNYEKGFTRGIFIQQYWFAVSHPPVEKSHSSLHNNMKQECTFELNTSHKLELKGKNKKTENYQQIWVFFPRTRTRNDRHVIPSSRRCLNGQIRQISQIQSNPVSQEWFFLGGGLSSTGALSLQCISTQCWIKSKQGFQGFIWFNWINIYANANANAHSHVCRNLWSKCVWRWIWSIDSLCSSFDLIAGLRFLSVLSQTPRWKCQHSRKPSLLLKP